MPVILAYAVSPVMVNCTLVISTTSVSGANTGGTLGGVFGPSPVGGGVLVGGVILGSSGFSVMGGCWQWLLL